jgi:preprotein translocase subunit SecE
MAQKSKKNPKKRKPKGKPLSESLRAKDSRASESLDQAEDEAEEDAEEEADELASQPPPATSFEDEHEDEPADEPAARAEEEEEEDEEPAGAAKGSEEYEDEPAADEPEGGDRAAAGDGPVSSVRGDGGEGDEEDDDEAEGAKAMGYQRYILSAWFGLWVVVSYILGRTTEGVWTRVVSKDWVLRSKNAFLRFLVTVDPDADRELLNRHSISLLFGGLLAGAIILRYYFRPDVRTWADEVADELSKVKWPTRKEVGNNTVVVIVASAVLTFYLLILDRFWHFVTNLIYSAGV